GGSVMDSNSPLVVMPSMWQEGQINGNRQQYQQLWHFDGLQQPVWVREEDNNNFTAENSLLSYDSSANSGKSRFDTTKLTVQCVHLSLSILMSWFRF
ncbi:unnamed protein product, partial [Ilex paraguariensis]